MDPENYAIRPFSEVDYEAMARVDRSVDPDHARTAQELRHWDQVLMSEPNRVSEVLLVEDRKTQEVVAYGSLQHSLFSFHPKKFWLFITVSPTHQRQGIGTELHVRLDREARIREATCLWSGTREDHAAGLRFMDRQGFAIHRKSWESRLDVGAVDPSSVRDRSVELRAQGLRFTTLFEDGSSRSDVRHRLFQLHEITSADVPRMGEYAPITFDQFVEFDLESPRAVPEGWFLAAQGDEYVGLTSLMREEGHPDTLRVGLTGTHPAFRGRGIAFELKRRAVEYAREHQIRFLVTHNDSRNHAIWAINEQLGFRREVAWVEGEKTLTPGPT